MDHFHPPYTEKIVPDAYHGTTEHAAGEILSNGFTLDKKSSDSWFGFGVYFWEGDLGEAEKWAHRICEKCDSLEWAVIRSKVNLGRLIDLFNSRHLEQVLSYRKRIQKRIGSNTSITDAQIINYIAESCEIDCVRGGVEEDCFRKLSESERKDRGLFINSRLTFYRHLMICVRRTQCILSIDKETSGKLS